MGWTNDTYTGLRMTGQPSNYRYAMFELARALNERQSAVRVSTTKFIKADETQGDHVTFAEFENLHMSHYCTNMGRIQAGILGLIGTSDSVEFITAGGTVYTQASVEAAIGASLSTNMAKPNDTAFLQAMQDALDLLIYARIGQGTFLSGGGLYTWHGATSLVDLQTAWANMTAGSSGSDLTSARAVLYQAGQAGVNYYANRTDQTKSQTIDCTVYDNGIDVTGGRYYVDADNQCNKDITLSVTSSAGISSGTSPQGTDQIITIEMAQPDCNTTTPTGVNYGFHTLETNVPFDAQGVSTFKILTAMEIDMDLSPILTDRA